MKRSIHCLLLAFTITSPALAQSPAARVSDLTSHGGVIVGPGVPTVVIEGRSAAGLGDQITCPLVTGPVPHVGGPIVTASATVRIGGRAAARVGDVVVENGPSSTILLGALTVIIGP
jgi:uncharacterized Zn-binding protein involved in type VI secretion